MLIFASTVFLFAFQQEFEQWCDMRLTDRELAQIRATPLIRLSNSPIQSFLAMANIPSI